MKVVEIRRRRAEDGSVERLARVYAPGPNEPARIEVLVPELREGIELMIAEGAADDSGNWLELADGERFVSALPSFYHGSRFWAVEVEE